MGTRLAIMKKSKKKSKAKGKKSTKSKKAKSPAEVRQDISKLVTEHWEKMATAAIDQGEAGQFSQTKYLFELAGVFPVSTDGNSPTEQEESMAETVFRKLNIPTEPVKVNEDEDEDEAAVVTSAEGKSMTTEDTEVHGGKQDSSTAEHAQLVSVDAQKQA